jgi:HAD superfamily hydrolase (TIGR01509 family)
MSTQRTSAAVFFDIDGTLLDTNYLHTWAWSRALTEGGVPATMAQIHRLIGRDGDDLLTELAGRPDDQLSEAHARIFAELGDQIRPLPGAVDLVKAVHRQGLRVVIVTSAGKAELRLLLDALDCDDEIDTVVHGDDVSSAKPAPDIYRHALEETGGYVERTVALGDTVWDIQAARSAGLPCVAVETGGIARCELDAAGAIATYGSCAEIVASYNRSPFGTLGTAEWAPKRP